MELMSAAEYLAKLNIDFKFDEEDAKEVKFPYVPFEERRDLKKIEKVVKDIRPNYAEYQNAKLYKDNHCKMWVHVCEATIEEGITPSKFVPQSLPINDIEEKEDLVNDFCESDSELDFTLSASTQ